MDKFLEGDIEKVKEVKDYLINEVQNEDYVALYPGELWMIMYWTGEHEMLPGKILQFNLDSINKFQHRIAPERDLLYTKLIEKSWEELIMLEYNIDSSELDPQAKDFLLLHLNFMVSGEPLMRLSQEEVNKMADLYLETHPESPYEDYLRNNIRYRYAPSKWAFGFEFFSGFGMFTGELSEQYSNSVLLGFDFDVEYKKFTLFLRGHIGIGKLKKDKEFSSGIWEEGSAANIGIPEASIGYAVVENDKIKLSPFLGIGGIEITAPQNDLDKRPELDEAGVSFSAAYTLGLNMNIKLGWDASSYQLYHVPKDKSYWFLRVRYGYTLPQINQVGHNGNFHHITIGIGGIHRGMKRVL